VTADGSIDCQEDPGEQESKVSSLHYCEVVSALHILAKGKLKVFLFLLLRTEAL
jgi:cap2 methyltransferase